MEIITKFTNGTRARTGISTAVEYACQDENTSKADPEKITWLLGELVELLYRKGVITKEELLQLLGPNTGEASDI